MLHTSRAVLLSSWLAAWIAAASLGGGQAAAQPPDYLRHYGFVPRLSELTISGGFAGIHHTGHIKGTFDLHTGYERESDPLPALIPIAEFLNVDAVTESPWPGDPLSLDAVLNLSRLDGTFSDPNELRFWGEENQGAPLHLEASLSGRRLQLTGRSDPPCCDFFQYEIDAVAVLRPWGDFNTDGRTDLKDYILWRDGNGSAVDLRADSDGNGMVDDEDYLMWVEGFADSMAIEAAAAGAEAQAQASQAAGASAVPEPAAWLVALLAAAGIAGLRRRQ